MFDEIDDDMQFVIGLGQDETGLRFYCDRSGLAYVTAKTLNIDSIGGPRIDKVIFHHSLLQDCIECIAETAQAAPKPDALTRGFISRIATAAQLLSARDVVYGVGDEL